jgi:hypothetical protein
MEGGNVNDFGTIRMSGGFLTISWSILSSFIICTIRDRDGGTTSSSNRLRGKRYCIKAVASYTG